jgi:SAM-dependent methyltransferase
MAAHPTSWQDAEVARRFLDERRAAIPYAADQVEMMLRLVRHFLGEPRRILDLGCGDGFLARTVLSNYPSASAALLDHSGPMLERARTAMKDFADRCTLLPGDMADPLPALTRDVAPDGFDLILSGYAIHHLPHARKRTLFAEIYSLLHAGGLFVNVEHVASATPRGEALFDAVYIDHLAARLGRPRAEVEHEYHNRPDRADNILAPVEVQIDWLREVGFAHADCYFKWLELAVFGGVKS